MAKDNVEGYPIGNTDPEKRGRNLPRPERDSGDGVSRDELSKRPRGGKPGYGETTNDKK